MMLLFKNCFRYFFLILTVVVCLVILFIEFHIKSFCLSVFLPGFVFHLVVSSFSFVFYQLQDRAGFTTQKSHPHTYRSIMVRRYH